MQITERERSEKCVKVAVTSLQLSTSFFCLCLSAVRWRRCVVVHITIARLSSPPPCVYREQGARAASSFTLEGGERGEGVCVCGVDPICPFRSRRSHKYLLSSPPSLTFSFPHVRPRTLGRGWRCKAIYSRERKGNPMKKLADFAPSISLRRICPRGLQQQHQHCHSVCTVCCVHASFEPAVLCP